METFTLKLTEESSQLFGYSVGAKIGPFKIKKIIREYTIPTTNESVNDYFRYVSEPDSMLKPLKNVKIIEFECSIN